MRTIQLEQQYDVVVVGGGVAGLASAVALARMQRSVLVVDAGEPRNAPAAGVHNYLGREGVAPRELVSIGRTEVAGYGGVVVDGRVSSVSRTSASHETPLFAVELHDGRRTTARRLVLATGGGDELPPVPGLRELWGTRVLHCPFCHGWEVRGRGVGVLSTGPMTAHAAALWRQVTPDLVVFTHTGPTLGAEQREPLVARGVRFVDGQVVAVEPALGGSGVLVRLASGEVVERDAVVAASVVRVDEALTRPLGVEVAAVEVMGAVMGTRVVADATGATSAPGVWVAGNAAGPTAVVLASAAGGQMAGAAVTMDLVTEDAAAAVSALRSRDAVGATR